MEMTQFDKVRDQVWQMLRDRLTLEQQSVLGLKKLINPKIYSKNLELAIASNEGQVNMLKILLKHFASWELPSS